MGKCAKALKTVRVGHVLCRRGYAMEVSTTASIVTARKARVLLPPCVPKILN